MRMGSFFVLFIPSHRGVREFDGATTPKWEWLWILRVKSTPSIVVVVAAAFLLYYNDCQIVNQL